MMDTPTPEQRIDESRALDLAWKAVEEAGGTRMIYRSPRHPFSMHTTRNITIESYEVEIRWGEISSPAVASVGGYVFEIHDEELELLIRPPRRR
ncbi:MAG TPA: protein-L-isoaspartate o-methyltransferase 1 [Thermomicrobiales bacterium]|nr:protein-L-isoaspartate o-methyltransferase 1 [Thermomicrobiales bacterium]